MNPVAPPTFRPSYDRTNHNSPLPRLRNATHAHISSPDSRSQLVCRFFSRGQCRNGDACPFSHPKDQTRTASSSTSQAQPLRSNHEVIVPPKERNGHLNLTRSFNRTIMGASMRFAEGASVADVALPSDFSAVHIDHLPHESSQETVLELLRSHGFFKPALSDIRLNHRPGPVSAHVKVQDPDFAKAVCSKLRGLSASRNATDIQLFATQVEALVPSGANALRVDCKKVHCSWHKPFKTVWLNFGSEQIATRVQQNFKREIYKICDQAVKVSDPSRGGGRFNRNAWTLCLTEVPAAATQQDLSRSVKNVSEVPCHIEIGKSSYAASAAESSTSIKSLFTDIGELEWWELTLDTSGKRMKASARFRDEESARQAVEGLKDVPLPFNPKSQLTISLV